MKHTIGGNWFLLLAAPTSADTILLQPVLSWTSSFVGPMALMSRLTQPIHLCFVLHRFLLSRTWYNLQNLSSDVFFVSTLDVSKPPQSSFPAPLCDILFLMLSFLISSHSVWPHAHLLILIYVTSSFFTWELVIGTLSIPCSIAG